MKIYYGWVLVAISCLLFALVVGASLQAIGLFVIPASKTLGLSRAQFNVTAILLNIGIAFAGPLVGRTLDLQSIRRVMLVCAIMFGASLAALGFSSDLRLSGFVIFVFLSIAVVGAGTLTAPTLLSRWFVIHRGRAMAIATAGIPLGSVVVVPLMAHTIAILGWRHALIATGLVVGGMLAIMALFVRDAPGPRDVEPGSTEIETFRTTSASAAAVADEGPIAVGQLLKTSRFWAFAIAAALAFGVVSSDILAIVPFAQGLGYSETQAAIIMPIFGMASLAGTLIYGWLGDRASPFGVFAGTCLVLGAANIGLWLAHSLATIDVAVAILGLATGVLTPVYLALIATAFGSSSFGVVSGCASFVSTFVSAGAIRFGGEVFDRTGNYQIMLVTFSVVTLIAAALIALSWRIRPTALVQA